MNFNYMKLLNRVLAVVIAAMLILLVFGLIVGVVRLFMDVGRLAMEKELTRSYLAVVTHVLTLFVLLELVRSIADYFTSHRLRMTFIVDAAIVFVLREVMIGLFEHRLKPDELYATSALLLVLTVLRIGSDVLHQRRTALNQHESTRER